jgi:hypothetical protein
VKLIVGLLVGVVLFPILAVAAVIGLAGLVLAVIVPLLPLLVVGLLVWLLVKAASPIVA